MNDRTIGLLIQGNPACKVLLGFKKRGFGQGKITGIGGKVEAGETFFEAAIRELAEEIDVVVRVEDLRYVAVLDFRFPAKPEWDQIGHVFLIGSWTGEPLEGDEVIPQWFAVDDLPYARMWQDASYWLPHVLRGERIEAIFVFAEDNETVEKFDITPWEN